MSDFDCQGMADMSTKELYVLNFWRRALIECYKKQRRGISGYSWKVGRAE